MDMGQFKNNGDGNTDLEVESGKDNKQEGIEEISSQKLIFEKKLHIDTLREENRDCDSFHMDVNQKSIDDVDLNNGKSDKKNNSLIKDKQLFAESKLLSRTRMISSKLGAAWNGYIHISNSSLIFPVAFLISTVIYLEIIIHLLNYRSIDLKIIYPILFAIPLGIFIGVITALFNSTVNKCLFTLFIGLACLLFAVQLIYYSLFKVYFSFQSIGMAGDALSEFGADALPAVKANIGGILLLFVPLFILILLFFRQIDFSRRGLKLQILLIGVGVVFHLVALASLLLTGKADYSPYDLYYKSRVQDLCGKELGITVMTRIDITNLIGGKEKLVLVDTRAIKKASVTTLPTKAPSAPVMKRDTGKKLKPTIKKMPPPTPIDTSPNIMNIDFLNLAAKETNKTIKTLDKYFASVEPTNKNKYTGMFQGYNLILITAEGFSPYAVHKEKTPTLYKLIHEGFVFNNFYTPLWQTSTSDGEYVALTGLIPTGTRSMYKGRKNAWPFALGNQFNKLGVASRAYHNHTYTYYQRNETHPNLGYSFKAKGNGLVLEHPDTWPESDLEMIDSTVEEYVKNEPFHVYYLTVSGHMNYSFSGNSISNKNQAMVADLQYSEDVRAYIACQIELDKALELLIKKLEAAGVANRTVIALSADHYPYAWDKKILDEAAGHTLEPVFEKYKNHFILWCKGMKQNIVIDKPCSSLDILPTLSNLFGLSYDSRLLMGRDILSDAPPLVILSNRSFITDKVMYNSETGDITMLTKEDLPRDYVSNIINLIKNKFSVSKSILNENYYRYIFRNGK